MDKYFLSARQYERYHTHGIASFHLSELGWDGAAINLASVDALHKVRHVWVRGKEVKISSGRNQSPRSALEISTDQPLSELVVLPHRFHASDEQEYRLFLKKLGKQYKIFETEFRGFDGIRVAIEPVYSS